MSLPETSDGALPAALARIEDLIRLETGGPLRDAARSQLGTWLAELARSRPPETAAEAFSSREVTVLLTDLRGFSALSETFPAHTVLSALNTYLERMSEVVIRHGGTIDKFMGDSVMALFGAPTSREDDVQRAVACAVDMQIEMVTLNVRQMEAGLPELFMGIGINTGSVMAGTLGSHLHSEYTVIGDEVNLASRIEAFSLRGQILISESTYARCGDFVTVGEPSEIFVKGKAKQVTVHEVLGIPSLGKEIPRVEIRRSLRVNVKMPFTYQVVVGKAVQAEWYPGTIVDISYHGVLAEIDRELPAHSEIKMKMDLVLVDHTVTDAYARVLRSKPLEDRVQINIEFTSVSVQSSVNIRRFVQMLMQGSGAV